MDFIYTTDRNEGNDFSIPTPIELSVQTEDMNITIKGACGNQVSQTLQTVLRNKRRNSGDGDAVVLGLAIAFCAGLVIVFSFAFYELGKKTNDQPITVGRLP